MFPRVVRLGYVKGIGLTLGLYLLVKQTFLVGWEKTECAEKAEDLHHRIVGRLPSALNYDVRDDQTTSTTFDPRGWLRPVDDVAHNLTFDAVPLDDVPTTQLPPWKVFYKQMITERSDTAHSWPWGNITTRCNRKYLGDISALPPTSVIITFHDHEVLSNILHTVHSVLLRTPESLLKEVILIDDNSKKDDLREILDNYVRNVFGPVVRVIRSTKPLGLIRARLLGTTLARGEAFVVMDSHMEVQEKWLEHLLYEIRKDPKTLAASYLDWMEYFQTSGTWKYQHGASQWKTYFDWKFVFGFQDIPVAQQSRRGIDPTQPIRSPVTVGTIWAMDKSFFQRIGGLDDGMQGWGGENLDIAIRVWLFGGQVLNVPCSHAGHYESPRSRDYRRGWEGQIQKNYKRVAEVWLDKYRDVLYSFNPDMADLDAGNISSRLELKSRAVYDFAWYLDHVFPELGIPQRDGIAWGGLMNKHSGRCLEIVGMNDPGVSFCRPKTRQGFYWARGLELRLPVYVFNTKLLAGPTTLLATQEYLPVADSTANSKFLHWKGGAMIEWRSLLCLDSPSSWDLILKPCNWTSPTQMWHFSNYSDSYDQLLSPWKGSDSDVAQKVLRQVLHLVHNGRLDEIMAAMKKRGTYDVYSIPEPLQHEQNVHNNVNGNYQGTPLPIFLRKDDTGVKNAHNNDIHVQSQNDLDEDQEQHLDEVEV